MPVPTAKASGKPIALIQKFGHTQRGFDVFTEFSQRWLAGGIGRLTTAGLRICAHLAEMELVLSSARLQFGCSGLSPSAWREEEGAQVGQYGTNFI